jgi:hypothetical protein
MLPQVVADSVVKEVLATVVLVVEVEAGAVMVALVVLESLDRVLLAETEADIQITVLVLVVVELALLVLAEEPLETVLAE